MISFPIVLIHVPPFFALFVAVRFVVPRPFVVVDQIVLIHLHLFVVPSFVDVEQPPRPRQAELQTHSQRPCVILLTYITGHMIQVG